MGWPDGPVGRGLNGLARPDIRPTDRAWAVRQARWTVQARPGGPAGQKGPSPIGPCLARARAVPCRAGPLLIFMRDKVLFLITMLRGLFIPPWVEFFFK